MVYCFVETPGCMVPVYGKCTQTQFHEKIMEDEQN
jgi:hypothetical protein